MFFFEGPRILFKVAVAVIHLTFGSPKGQKGINGFFELTRKLRDLPIEFTHEDILIPEVIALIFNQYFILITVVIYGLFLILIIDSEDQTPQ